MRDPSMRDIKKEFNGSRDFLWKVLLRDNVEHSSGKNVETTSLKRDKRDKSEEVKRHERKNIQSLIATELCVPVACTVPTSSLLNATSEFSGPSFFRRVTRAQS